jgi:Tfp pilus assembly ATPase PilU
MEVSSKEEGMQTMEQALAELVSRNIVSMEEALMKSSNPLKLKQLFQPGVYDILFSTENDKRGAEVENNPSHV